MELPRDGKYDLPPFTKIKRDITDDPDFSVINMAKAQIEPKKSQ
jgi:hypothetical protein